MTFVPDSIATGARETLVANYEDLRHSALGRVSGTNRGIGFALFVRSGMAAWMATCTTLLRPPKATIRRSLSEQSLVPQDFRVEVATLLAEMALAAHAQGAITP